MAKTTVALTAEATEALDLLKRFDLPELVDIVRLGFSYAVVTGLGIDRPPDFGVPGGAGNYTASTATLDHDRRLEGLVHALHGDLAEEPYFTVETLANKGVLAIASAVKAGEIGTLSDLISDHSIS